MARVVPCSRCSQARTARPQRSDSRCGSARKWRRFRSRPCLGSEHPQRRTGRRHCQTRVKPEPARGASVVDAPQPFSIAVERQRRRVVQHQDPLVPLAPQPRLLGVWRVYRVEGHLVVIQESVSALQLPLGPHRLGEAQTWIARQIQPDPLQPLAAASIRLGPHLGTPTRCLPAPSPSFDQISRQKAIEMYFRVGLLSLQPPNANFFLSSSGNAPLDGVGRRMTSRPGRRYGPRMILSETTFTPEKPHSLSSLVTNASAPASCAVARWIASGVRYP